VSAAPGWYPDPAGQPGQFRYWDGQTWFPTTSPSPYAAPPASPAGSPVRPQKRSSLGWILGGLAVVAVLAVALILVIRNLSAAGGGSGPTPVDPSAASPCPEAASPSSTPPAQTGDRVRSGRLSYPRLGDPFSAPTPDARTPFGRDVQNQEATVETKADGSPSWVAAVLIARLLAGDGFYGPEQGARVVATCVIGRFYGDAEVQRADRRNQAISVDDHPAWVIEMHLTFDIPGIKTKGELATIVVVDTADGEAGLFYASLPDTSPQFLEPARTALAELTVT
jgi:hypothetical protein